MPANYKTDTPAARGTQLEKEQPALKIRDLSAGYPGRPVLTGVDLDIPARGFTALIGKNGCGKTTLVKTLAGRIRPLAGSVLAAGGEVASMDPKRRARLVSYLPQVRDVPSLTCRTLVEHGRFAHLGFPRILSAADKAAVEEAMALTGAAAFAELPAARLSGGERQRVYLAMTLAQRAEILLLDEPTTYLDLSDGEAMLAMLRNLSRQKSVVAVLHDLDAALRYADFVCLIDGGAIAARGTPEEVFASGQIQRVFYVEGETVSAFGGKHYLFYHRD